MFFELYTVHASTSGIVHPCLFALLPSKTQDTYRRLFTAMKDTEPALRPATVTLDFERAAINAVRESFPDAAVNGCFYHLAQSVYRRVQSSGLQDRYSGDEAFSLSVRLLPALAFVPPEHVIEAFEMVQEILPPDAEPISDYFEDTYIGRIRRARQRGNPKFDIPLWNVFNRVDADLPRTNNAVEGWNRRIKAAVTCAHPNIWRFLAVLQKEQSLSYVQLDQVLGGHVPPPRKRKYMDSNNRLVTISRDFANRNIVDYLRSIAHNISM